MEPDESEDRRPPAVSVLDIARAREGPQFYIVDASMRVRLQHIDGAAPQDIGALPGDVALAAMRLLRGALRHRNSEIALVRADLALRMIRLAGDEALYALFLERYQARDLVRTATEQYNLSAREAGVLHRMLRGDSANEIGAALHIEVTTVQQHIKNIGLKIGVTKRNAIVAAVLGTIPARAERRKSADHQRRA